MTGLQTCHSTNRAIACSGLAISKAIADAGRLLVNPSAHPHKPRTAIPDARHKVDNCPSDPQVRVGIDDIIIQDLGGFEQSDLLGIAHVDVIRGQFL